MVSNQLRRERRMTRMIGRTIGGGVRRLARALRARAVGCGGDDLVLPNEGQPATLAIVRGDRQNGTVGSGAARFARRFVSPTVSAIRSRTPRSPGSPDNGGSVDPATSTTDGAGPRRHACAPSAPQPGTYTTQRDGHRAHRRPDHLRHHRPGRASSSFVTQPGRHRDLRDPARSRSRCSSSATPKATPSSQAGVSVTVQIAERRWHARRHDDGHERRCGARDVQPIS